MMTDFIYTIVDKYGFIGAFDDIKKAMKIVKKWENTVELFILKFPFNSTLQKEEIYFLPYRGHDTDNKYPVALVTNDRMYFLRVQTKLLKMEMTYPDSIDFFTKRINCIDPIEFGRLIDKKLRYKEDIMDVILTKISQADKEDLKKPFHEMMASIITDQYDILGPKSEYVCTQTSTSSSHKQPPENIELPNSEEIEDSYQENAADMPVVI